MSGTSWREQVAWRWLFVGALAGPTLVSGIALLAIALTNVSHDPDEGANLAGVWGFLLGPVVAVVTSGALAARYSRERPLLNGLLAAYVAYLSSWIIIEWGILAEGSTGERLTDLLFWLAMGALHLAVALAGIAPALRRRHHDPLLSARRRGTDQSS